METSWSKEFGLAPGKIGFLIVFLCDGVVDGEAVASKLIQKSISEIKVPLLF
jgi:hypothetical protein